MKNKVLKLTALSFCAALLFTSCKKDDKEKIERGDVVGVWYLSDLGAGSNDPTEFHGKIIELHITSDGSVTRWETYPDTVYDETGNYTVKLKQWVTMGVLDGTGTDLELNGTITAGDPKLGKMADKWVTIPKVTPFTVNGKSIQINDYKINWFSGKDAPSNEKVVTPLCHVREPYVICNDTVYHFGNDVVASRNTSYNAVQSDWKECLTNKVYDRYVREVESIDENNDTTYYLRHDTVAIVSNNTVYVNTADNRFVASPKYQIYSDATIRKSVVLASDISFKHTIESFIIHSRSPKKTVDAGNYVICWGNRFTVRTSNDGKVLWFKYNTNENSGSSFTETYLRR